MIKKIKPYILIFSLIFVWQLVSYANIVPTYLLPSPIHILQIFLKMICSGELIFHILISLRRVLIGFAISCILAFFFATINGIFDGIDIYYIKILEFLRHTPPISLIPLLILWFGIGETSKIIVIILTSFSPIFVNTHDAISNCDNKYIEVGKIFKLSKLDMLLKIKIPFAIPQIVSGMKIGLGYSFRAIIGAEMISASKGIGYLIINSQTLFRIDKIIVGVISIGIIGILIDFVFDVTSKILFKKYYYK